MIICQTLPLPPLRAKELQQWMGSTPAQLLRDVVTARITRLQVDAANAAIDASGPLIAPTGESAQVQSFIDEAKRLKDFLTVWDMIHAGENFSVQIAPALNVSGVVTNTT